MILHLANRPWNGAPLPSPWLWALALGPADLHLSRGLGELWQSLTGTSHETIRKTQVLSV